MKKLKVFSRKDGRNRSGEKRAKWNGVRDERKEYLGKVREIEKQREKNGHGKSWAKAREKKGVAEAEKEVKRIWSGERTRIWGVNLKDLFTESKFEYTYFIVYILSKSKKFCTNNDLYKGWRNKQPGRGKRKKVWSNLKKLHFIGFAKNKRNSMTLYVKWITIL